MSRNKVVHKKIKHEVRFTQEMLMKRIAQETSLTQPQVKECMDSMFEIIEKITLHPDCPISFKFKMGNIGEIETKPRRGRKVGIYKRPDGFAKGKFIEDVIEVEEPSYQYLTFKMYPKYKEALRKDSIERSKNQKWFKTEIIGIDENGKKIKEIKSYQGWRAYLGSYYPVDDIVFKEE